MSDTVKLGIITTGQGPRNEYVDYHQNVMKYLGVDVEIMSAHALDGLTSDQINEIETKEGEKYIGCHIRVPGGTGDRMGPGWSHLGIDPLALVPLYQKHIDALEAKGVEDTILCSAKEYAIDAFHSNRPLIVPWLVVTEWTRVNTLYMAEPKVGILIPDEEHLQQNTETWNSQPWMDRLQIFIEVRKGRFDEALAEFKRQNVDMVINWGYGFGTAPEDPPDMIKRIEEASGAPFILPARQASIFARDLLRPSFDDRRFIREHVVNTPT